MPAHNAGRELDFLIAKRVMGWTGIGNANPKDLGQPPHADTYEWFTVPSYSTSMNAAWQVVEAMNLPEVVKCKNGKWGCVADRTSLNPLSMADTAPLAICRAALRSKRLGSELVDALNESLQHAKGKKKLQTTTLRRGIK